jgi:DNA polymerase-3 subunit gamma/tau
MTGSHKVYILDEAHMLSSQAWNAFLKTLEEPPSNTVFVLATTEAHKILPTVADRCHRFDFQRPTAVEVEEVVTRVAATEGINAPAEVLRTVARSADGSFRDALGTLEQLVTYAGSDGAVSAEDALAVLGVVDTEERFRALDAIVDGDPAEAVRVAADIASSGRDLRRFVEDLESHGRTLLLVDLAGSVPPELSMGEHGDERLATQAQALGRGGIIHFLDLVSEAFSAIRDGSDARLRLELLLVKAASGGSPAVPPRPQAPAATKVTPSAPTAPAPVPAPTPSAPESMVSTPAPVASGGGGSAAAALTSLPEPLEQEAAVPDVEAEPLVAAGPLLPFEDLAAAWPAVIAHVSGESAVLGAILAQAAPVALNDTQLLIAFPQSAEFHRRKAQDARHKQDVCAAFLAITGCKLELEYELSASVEIPEAPGEQPLSTDEVADILVNEFGGVEVGPATPEPGAGPSAASDPDLEA